MKYEIPIILAASLIGAVTVYPAEPKFSQAIVNLAENGDGEISATKLGGRTCLVIAGNFAADLILERKLRNGEGTTIDKSQFNDASEGVWTIGILESNTGALRIYSISQSEIEWSPYANDSEFVDRGPYCVEKLHVAVGKPAILDRIMLEGTDLWISSLETLN